MSEKANEKGSRILAKRPPNWREQRMEASRWTAVHVCEQFRWICTCSTGKPLRKFGRHKNLGQDHGYINTREATDRVIGAIRTALQGGSYASPQITTWGQHEMIGEKRP